MEKRLSVKKNSIITTLNTIEVLKAGKGSLKDEYIIFLMTLPLLLIQRCCNLGRYPSLYRPTPELDCGDGLRGSADWLMLNTTMSKDSICTRLVGVDVTEIRERSQQVCIRISSIRND